MKSISIILLLAAFSCTYFDYTIAGSVNVNAEANAKADINIGDGDDGEDPECPTICPQVVIPVCGRLSIARQTIYKTFGNGCQLGVENCPQSSNEQYRQVGNDFQSCESLQFYSICRSGCTREYNPVCGARYNNQGVKVYNTFGNPCDFWSTVCLKPYLRWEKIGDGEC